MSWDWDSTTLAALDEFLRAQGLWDGDPAPRRIGDGHSNLTYLIRIQGGGAVLRRPPPPPIPKGANDVLREARILTALQDQPPPTPAILAVAQPGEVLDVPFYIMQHIAGPIVSDQLPEDFEPSQDAPAMANALVEGLAQLHAVDWRACGLEGFGRPEGFNARHLTRMRGLMEVRTGSAPRWLADVADTLALNVPPESGAAILHNDFRLGNVIWSATSPRRLMAVLDWELATLGDPLLDLGYLICCHPEPDEPLNPTQELSRALLAHGAPTRSDLVARYAALTGRDTGRIMWYAAFAAWKLAVLYEYQHRQGRDAYYADETQARRFITSAERFLT